MTLKFEFASPNLLSYSIHERDEIELAVNLTTVVEGDGSRLWGKYVKQIPLQFPDQFPKRKI